MSEQTEIKLEPLNLDDFVGRACGASGTYLIDKNDMWHLCLKEDYDEMGNRMESEND